MAAQAELDDPLFNLRLSIARGSTPILSKSETPSDTTDALDFVHATHITFINDAQQKTFALTTPTRFAPNNEPLDLRAIYFAWVNRDAPLPDYIGAVQHLNEELPTGAGGSVHHLNFAQKIEVIAWLNGDTETSENIQPLEGVGLSVDAEKSAAIASGKIGGVAVDKGGEGQKLVDERLMVIYEGERKMGDHNTVLRGSKAVDFSSYRTLAQAMYKHRSAQAAPASLPSHISPMVPSMAKRKRLEPIILLSPSASSLLRMSNIKSFLDEGLFIPPNSTDTTSANLLNLNRVLPSISSQPMRFILVDSTAQFKPAYWDRVVAIFTTGQTWQFKSYKYPNPAELFAHYPGVFVGWQAEETPENVLAWGRGVLTCKVDKWTGQAAGRWRDREVVESVWARIEEHMRRQGWSQYGPGTASGAGR